MAAENKSNDPSFKIQDYLVMEQRWTLPTALMGGTPAMHEQGELYLPKHPNEEIPHWKSRLARTVLRNFFRRTIEAMTAKVFAKPIQLESDVPPVIAGQMENIDLTGRHLNVFSRDVFTSALSTGITHVLVDYPPVTEGATLDDERKAGVRPYAVHVTAEQLIGWRYIQEGGKWILTQIRIREVLKKPDGEFGEAEYTQVRVIERDKWRTYQQPSQKDAQWAVTDEGKMTLGHIPLSTFYTNRTNFMTAMPPLEDLAYMNLEHYQVRSDQRTSLSVASFPILAASGFTPNPDAKGTEIEFGPMKMLTMTNPEGKFYYVESQGAHLEQGRQEIVDLEDAMRQYALQFEMKKPGNQTATGRALDSAESHSQLEAWALQYGDFVENILLDFAAWQKLAEGGSVKMNTDFGLSMQDSADVEALYKARLAGEITRKTYLEELKRRGLLSDDFDIDKEIELLADEEPEATPQRNGSGSAA